jgi:hypothetical protein
MTLPVSGTSTACAATTIEARAASLRYSLGVGDDSDDVVCLVDDLKIETVVPVHSSLPDITGATVLLRLNGWVPKILAQKVQLLVNLRPQA